MKDYEELARELFMVFDANTKGPPHEEMSASLRGEMAVMRLLSRESTTLTAGDISRKLNMTTSRVAAVLGSLEKKGLIARSEDERDRRRVMVSITERGRAQHEEKKKWVIEDMRTLLEQLGEQDAAEFVRLMRRVREVDMQRRKTHEAECIGRRRHEQ